MKNYYKIQRPFQFFLISTKDTEDYNNHLGLSVLPYFNGIEWLKYDQIKDFQFFLISTCFDLLGISSPYFQFFLISTWNKNKVGNRMSLSVLPYFNWVCHIPYWPTKYFQFFLISTWPTKRQRQEGPLSVLPYFNSAIAMTLRSRLPFSYFNMSTDYSKMEPQAFSSSLFQLPLFKERLAVRYFQFFLISTSQLHDKGQGL